MGTCEVTGMVNMDYELLKEEYKKMIAKYLSDRCKEDLYLAEAVQKPGKTLDGVIKYVTSEARKKAQGNVAVIPDDEVYSWAVHYILEDSLDSEPGKAEKPVKEEKKAQKKESDKAELKIVKQEPTIAQELQLTFEF